MEAKHDWIKPTELLQDITKNLITYNASQLQDNPIRFKQSNLKILYIDVLSRHN